MNAADPLESDTKNAAPCFTSDQPRVGAPMTVRMSSRDLTKNRFNLAPGDFSPSQAMFASAQRRIFGSISHQETPPASLKIRRTLSSEKNSTGDMTFATIFVKSSIALWFPDIAPNNCCCSGVGGSKDAIPAVNS